jgi:class 3 adenylate cyclase
MTQTLPNFAQDQGRLDKTKSSQQKDIISSDLRYFTKQAFIRRSHSQRELVLRIAMFYNAIAMAILPIAGKPTLVNYFVMMHGCLFTLALLASFKTPMRVLLLRLSVPVLLISPSLINFYAAYYHIVENDQMRTIMGASTAIICGSFMSFIDPRSGLPRGLSALLCILVGFLAFSDSAAGGILAIVNGVAVGGSFAVTLIHDRDFRTTIEREYRLLVQAAPAKIVRESASSNVDVNKVFEPKMRHCVCLSSDWRDYQTVSASVSADSLASSLGRYYDMCENLLSQIFPDGNYYSDWIADEFFLVIFAKDQVEEKRLVNLTLKFAEQLIREKEVFQKAHGVPAAIDVGVSSGLALIGMMGPSGHRKATALGEVPGQARRLQVLGKAIRQSMGDTDRVIFAAPTLMEITEALAVTEFKLEDKKQLRNIDSTSVFYLEPLKKS